MDQRNSIFDEYKEPWSSSLSSLCTRASKNYNLLPATLHRINAGEDFQAGRGVLIGKTEFRWRINSFMSSSLFSFNSFVYDMIFFSLKQEVVFFWVFLIPLNLARLLGKPDRGRHGSSHIAVADADEVAVEHQLLPPQAHQLII